MRGGGGRETEKRRKATSVLTLHDGNVFFFILHSPSPPPHFLFWFVDQVVAPLNNRRRPSPIARCLLPRSMNFPTREEGWKEAACKRHTKINIPVDFIISIHHDARHTLQIRCLFDVSRSIARVSFDRTNYARFIEQLSLHDQRWHFANKQRIRYTLYHDVDRHIIHR